MSKIAFKDNDSILISQNTKKKRKHENKEQGTRKKKKEKRKRKKKKEIKKKENEDNMKFIQHFLIIFKFCIIIFLLKVFISFNVIYE
jgi:ATP-dependent Zn protease